MTTRTIDFGEGSRRRSAPRRRGGPQRARQRRRALGVAVLAALAFAAGAAVGAAAGDDGEDAVRAYAAAWERADWAAMHAQLTREARGRTPLPAFARANREALATATARDRAGTVRAGEPERDGDRWRLPVAVRTRIFGTVRGDVLVPVSEDGEAKKVAWRPRLVFPGLREGQELTRQTRLLERGAILARDRTPLAEGPERSSPIPAVAAQVVGELGPPEGPEAARGDAFGYPPRAEVGRTGLERVFQERLAGIPAGTLRAGDRVLARSAGRPGATVRTTISPPLVEAALAALGDRYGGAIAYDPRSGAVLAVAGAPFSLLQPPGSTFKIVTTAGALENGTAKLSDTYPLAGRATLSGVPLANAGGEICGGSLPEAFAESCNSVFAPMGVKLGPEKLVETAEAFGFNRTPPLPTIATSRIPQADAIGDDLAVGSTAIGQGKVEATAAQMAETAGVIASGGRRPKLTLDYEQARKARPGGGERVVSPRTARQMERLMIGVVAGGTGTAAAITGVTVAGKTGTAELRSRPPGDTSSNPADTTAWFVAYAPAGRGRTPRVVVGVVLPGQGAGGDSAAPVAQQVLAAGLKR